MAAAGGLMSLMGRRGPADTRTVELYLLVAVFIVGVFVRELGLVWWRETQWRRQRNRRGDD